MSSPKHHKVEEKRWPHVKRNWIKAIKAIRNGGGIFKGEFIWWNIRADSRLWSTSSDPTTRAFYQRQDNATLSFSASHGFSDSSSSDRLTEEQENEIAENIYDWWISGKSYKQWYAERFQQLKIDFGEES